MKKLLGLSAIVVLVLFLVSACTVTITTGANVSGTITLVGKYASGASVTVQRGSSVYSVPVYLSGGVTQTGTYSLSNIPFGTYTVYVDFYSSQLLWATANYYINGAGPYPFVPGGLIPNWTETIVAVSIQGDTTVDTYLN